MFCIKYVWKVSYCTIAKSYQLWIYGIINRDETHDYLQSDVPFDICCWFSYHYLVIRDTGFNILCSIGKFCICSKNCSLFAPLSLVFWYYSTRGLGKALAREFLLSGDRVVVASRRWEYNICFLSLYQIVFF